MSGAVFTPIAWKFGLKATSRPHANNTEACGGGPAVPASDTAHASDDQDESPNAIMYFWFMAM